jgi:hypothetical protein
LKKIIFHLFVSQIDIEREETTIVYDLVLGRNNKDRKQKQIEKTNRGLGGLKPKNKEKTLATRVCREKRERVLFQKDVSY